MMPVTPWRSIRVVAAWPPSSENSACSTGAMLMPRAGPPPVKPASLRREGNVVVGAEDEADAVVPERQQVA